MAIRASRTVDPTQAQLQRALHDRAEIQKQIEALTVGKDGTPKSNPRWRAMADSLDALDSKIRLTRSRMAPFNPALRPDQAEQLRLPQEAAAGRMVAGAGAALRELAGPVSGVAGRVGERVMQGLRDPGGAFFPASREEPAPAAPEPTPAEAASKQRAAGLRVPEQEPEAPAPAAAAPPIAPGDAPAAPEPQTALGGLQAPPGEIPEFGIGQVEPGIEEAPPTDRHRAEADLTPEIAAFRAAIDAPAPQFAGLGFTGLERMALGIVAGMRGLNAVLPYIESRRRDAQFAFNAARENRAIKIREAEAAVNVAERQRTFEESKHRFDVQQDLDERRFDLAEMTFEQRERFAEMRDATTRRGQDLMFKARSMAAKARLDRLQQGRSITATQQGRLAKLYRSKAALNNIVDLILQANPGVERLEDADIPGTPLLFGAAVPGKQQQFKAAYQRATTALRRELFGAAQTHLELKGSDAFIANFGSLNSTMVNGILQIEQDINSAFLGQLRTMTAGGFDTELLELDAEDFGFFGRMPGPRSRAPIIPGVNGIDMIPEDWVLDATEVLEE